MDESPARAERSRLDRKAYTTGETFFDVACGDKGGNRLMKMSGEQEEVVKSAPPRLAEQRFEKRRAADVQQGLGRRSGPPPEAGPQSADQDYALIVQAQPTD